MGDNPVRNDPVGDNPMGDDPAGDDSLGGAWPVAILRAGRVNRSSYPQINPLSPRISRFRHRRVRGFGGMVPKPARTAVTTTGRGR
jgi:hypothetical protein